jgi:NADH:ubiquinone oxidoreductase subunit K
MNLTIIKLILVFIIVYLFILFLFYRFSLLLYIILIEILFLTIFALFSFISCEKLDIHGQVFSLYLLGIFAAETAIILTLFIGIYTTQLVEDYEDEENFKKLKQQLIFNFIENNKNFSMTLIKKKKLNRSIFIKQTLFEKIIDPKYQKEN